MGLYWVSFSLANSLLATRLVQGALKGRFLLPFPEQADSGTVNCGGIKSVTNLQRKLS